MSIFTPFSRRAWMLGLPVLCGALLLSSSSAHAADVTLSNPTPIESPYSAGVAAPYPSVISSTVYGRVTKATVVLNNFFCTFPADMDVLLVAPSGQSVILMSDVFDGGDATDTTLTISDDAPTRMPENAALATSGNVFYKPTDYNGDNSGDPDFYPAPAPVGPYGTTMSALNGASTNGDWKLFVLDDTTTEPGVFAGGWTLNLTYDPAPVVSYETPDPNQKIPLTELSSGSIAGTATDDAIVSAVKVRLSRKRDGVNEFWNGTNWVSNSLTFVDADLTNNPAPVGVGSSSVTWSLDTNAPPQSKLDAGQYGVRVYGVDDQGSKGATLDRIFFLYTDNVLPNVAIISPTSSQVVDINSINGTTINGRAWDNVGVSSVKLKLGRKRGNVWQYWNGTDFTTASATFDATVTTVGDTSVTWQMAAAIPAGKLDRGSYALYATAYDAAGNKYTSSSRLFAITGNVAVSAPDAAVDNSSAGRS